MDSTLYRAMAIVDSTRQVDYKEGLDFALSMAAFRSGSTNNGILRMQTLISTAQKRAIEYVETLGTYYMALGDFSQAIEPLEEAKEGGSSTALFKLAVVLSELASTEQAIMYWEQLKGQEDASLNETATTMIAVLGGENFEPKDDYEKYLFAHYHRLSLDEIDLLAVLKSIKDPDIMAKACLDLAHFYYSNADFDASNLFLEHIPKSITDPALEKSYELMKLNILAQSDALKSQDYENFIATHGFSTNEYLQDLSLQAKMQVDLDSTKYLHLGNDNAFFVDGVLAAAAYFKNNPDQFKSYNFVADALNYNPHSSRLLYAYVIQAASIGFIDYAEDALYQYGQKFPGQRFNNLLKEYEQLKQQFENLVEPEE